MKKKTTNQKLDNHNSEFDALNSQLGSFGLEPPKLYREEKRKPATNDNSKKAQPKKRVAKKNTDNLNFEEKNAVNKKRRKLKRGVKNALIGIGTALAVILVIVFLSLTVLFKVDTIKVTGNHKYTKDQITAVLPIQKEDNLFLIKTNQAKEKLCSNLPYIYDVEITRKLPSTVQVKVIEPSKIYYIKNADKSFTYFDNNFKLIDVATKKTPKSGVFIQKLAIHNQVVANTADIKDKDKLNDIKAMMKCVDDLQIKEITSIYSENLTSNYLVYDNRITIKIGETKDIEDKMYSALATIEKLNVTNPQAEGTLTSMGGKRVYFTETK